MWGWVRVLPLLAVTLAAVVPPPPPGEWSVQYVIDLHNSGICCHGYLYKLVDTDVDNTAEIPTSPGKLQFKIKETECQKKLGTPNIETCAFKDAGVVKQCTATLFHERANTLVVSCNTMGPKTQVRRPRQTDKYTTRRRNWRYRGKGTDRKPGVYIPLSDAESDGDTMML